MRELERCIHSFCYSLFLKNPKCLLRIPVQGPPHPVSTHNSPSSLLTSSTTPTCTRVPPQPSHASNRRLVLVSRLVLVFRPAHAAHQTKRTKGMTLRTKNIHVHQYEVSGWLETAYQTFQKQPLSQPIVNLVHPHILNGTSDLTYW